MQRVARVPACALHRALLCCGVFSLFRSTPARPDRGPLPAMTKTNLFLSRFCAATFLAFALFLAPLRAADVGVITGTVSNSATGNLLEGARVEVPQLGLSTLTDNTGSFVLGNVPAGTYEAVVSYIG